MTRALLATLAVLAAGPVAAQDIAAGETTFRQRCAACHTVDGANRTGPTLLGVVGREAGSVEGFRYSGALADSGLTWSAELLEQFLENPRDMVRGTRMVQRLPSAEDRANVVGYLATLE